MASRRCASRDWPPRTRLFPPLFFSFFFFLFLAAVVVCCRHSFYSCYQFFFLGPFTPLSSLVPSHPILSPLLSCFFPFSSSASYFILTRRERKTAAIESRRRRQPTEWIKRVAIKDDGKGKVLPLSLHVSRSSSSFSRLLITSESSST